MEIVQVEKDKDSILIQIKEADMTLISPWSRSFSRTK